MRLNLEIGPGDNRLADVTVFGRVAHVSIWMGDPVEAVESRYTLQFDDTWATKSDLQKCDDALRVAVAHALNNAFDPFLIELLPESESARWQGRIFPIAGPSQ